MEFENLKNILEDFGNQLVTEYKDKLILENINASDALYNSVQYIVSTPTNGTFEVKLSLMDYWKYIENGRAAGKMPPISAIQKWVEIKPVLPRPMSNGKLPTVQQLSYLIAHKIGLEGTKGKHILQRSIDEVWDVYREFIGEAIAKDIDKEITFELGKLRV